MENINQLRLIIWETFIKMTEEQEIREGQDKNPENDDEPEIELPPNAEDVNAAPLDELDALPPPIELNNY